MNDFDLSTHGSGRSGVGCWLMVGGIVLVVGLAIAGAAAWMGMPYAGIGFAALAVVIALEIPLSAIIRERRAQVAFERRVALAEFRADLGEVEPELSVPPPRPRTWALTQVRPDGADEVLRRWVPVRAWISKAERSYVSSGDAAAGEDPLHGDVWITSFEYGYRFEGKLHVGWGQASSTRHRYPDRPASRLEEWCAAHLRVGGALTVLVNPSSPGEHRSYAELAPHLCDCE